MAEWKAKANEVFLAAAEVESPAERQLFLDQHCGNDADLREQVESLLAASAKVGSFLNKPAAQALPGSRGTAAYEPIAERPGTVIGVYKLMEQIGEGGMGLVFVAEQQQPVRRKVALKVIKPGMDTREVIARFEAERQALALMDHPNIARVFDGGATESGRPYFVMELVKGIPVIEYCDQQQLTARERLALFLSICQAVQHAHSKGVIHRDLKPNNILVAPHDGVPVVKVIDFGVAKAVGQQLTDKTVYTRFNQMIGTPLYMSPEQAKINALDVDIRSDVYSLGVLLYELLTGATPFDSKRFATAAFDEIRRIIREEEPPKPSTRLSTLGKTLSKVSAQRKTEPAKLSALVKGDLDWIIMKALEKDRNRRYETASAFAADVRRFLNEEPIEVRQPSAFYRFRKLARRNKVALMTAGLVGLALVAGTIVSTWQAIRATRAKADAQIAEDQATKDRDLAREAEKRASEEKTNAEASLRFLLDDVLAQANPFERPDRNPSVNSLMDQAARRLEQKKDMPPLVEASIRLSLGKVYSGLADFETATVHLKRAFELRQQYAGKDDLATLEAAASLAGIYGNQGDFARARSFTQLAFDGYRRLLAEDDPRTLDTMFGLAMGQAGAGDAGEAAALYARGLELSRRRGDPIRTAIFLFGLGVTYRDMGRYREASPLFDEALRARELVGDDNPNVQIVRIQRIELLVRMKRFDDAEGEAKKAIRLAKAVMTEHDPLPIMGEAALAHVYFAQGKRSDAEPYVQRVREAAQPTKAPLPWLMVLVGVVGRDLLEHKEYARAEPFLRVSAEFAEKKFPEGWRRASLVGSLGGCLLGQKKYVEAEPFLLRGFEGLQKSEEKTLKPCTPERRREEAAKLTENVKWLVQLYEETGKHEEAARWRKRLGERGGQE